MRNAETPWQKLRLLYRLWKIWCRFPMPLGRLMDVAGLHLIFDQDDESLLKALHDGGLWHQNPDDPDYDEVGFGQSLFRQGWRTKDEWKQNRRLLYRGESICVVSETLWVEIDRAKKKAALDEFLKNGMLGH